MLSEKYLRRSAALTTMQSAPSRQADNARKLINVPSPCIIGEASSVIRSTAWWPARCRVPLNDQSPVD